MQLAWSPGPFFTQGSKQERSFVTMFLAAESFARHPARQYCSCELVTASAVAPACVFLLASAPASLLVRLSASPEFSAVSSEALAHAASPPSVAMRERTTNDAVFMRHVGA